MQCFTLQFRIVSGCCSTCLPDSLPHLPTFLPLFCIFILLSPLRESQTVDGRFPYISPSHFSPTSHFSLTSHFSPTVLHDRHSKRYICRQIPAVRLSNYIVASPRLYLTVSMCLITGCGYLKNPIVIDCSVKDIVCNSGLVHPSLLFHVHCIIIGMSG